MQNNVIFIWQLTIVVFQLPPFHFQLHENLHPIGIPNFTLPPSFFCFIFVCLRKLKLEVKGSPFTCPAVLPPVFNLTALPVDDRSRVLTTWLHRGYSCHVKHRTRAIFVNYVASFPIRVKNVAQELLTQTT